MDKYSPFAYKISNFFTKELSDYTYLNLKKAIEQCDILNSSDDKGYVVVVYKDLSFCCAYNPDLKPDYIIYPFFNYFN